MAHCLHFGSCGGCAVAERSAINKSRLLITTLHKAGFADTPMAPLVEIPLRSRRRVDLAASRTGPIITLGLHRARSHEIVDMAECVLLAPQILQLLPPLRVLLRSLQAFRNTGSVIINLLDTGPDILFRLDADVAGPDKSKLIAFARAHSAPRVSTAKAAGEPELVVMLSPPVITFSGVKVEPPPGAFLQASTAGEAAIIRAVLAGLPKLNARARIMELYAGIGTLSFALAKHGRVEAYEGAADAAAAQDAAIRRNNLTGRMSVSVRDLGRRPLKISEIAGTAAVVLDPPFAGAAAQMKNLAAAGAPRIIYVSCNPEALAKDAWLLNRAGYGVLNATPIDQFPYSENLESVVIFSRRG